MVDEHSPEARYILGYMRILRGNRLAKSSQTDDLVAPQAKEAPELDECHSLCYFQVLPNGRVFESSSADVDDVFDPQCLPLLFSLYAKPDKVALVEDAVISFQKQHQLEILKIKEKMRLLEASNS